MCPIFSKKKRVLVALELPTFWSPRCKNLPPENNKNTRYNINLFIMNTKLEAFWKQVYRVCILSLLEVASSNWVTICGWKQLPQTNTFAYCLLCFFGRGYEKSSHNHRTHLSLFFFFLFWRERTKYPPYLLSFFNKVLLAFMRNWK